MALDNIQFDATASNKAGMLRAGLLNLEIGFDTLTKEATNTWQVLTLTYDGTTATLYRNAVSVTTDTTALSARDSGDANLAKCGAT